MEKKTKVDEKTIKEITKSHDIKVGLTDEEFKALEDPLSDIPKEMEDHKKDFKEIYLGLQDILKNYIDMNDKYYPLISAWIIGTYIHKIFMTYPYLYFNAMKGSGKTRTLSLIAHLSHNGKVVVNMSEAVLFRTAKDSTICIDEFERVKGKEKANLRELLNAAYKKGIVVERAKKVKDKDSEEYEIEVFEVFCPVVMANISGMDEVLVDRSVKCLLERTSKKQIARKLEIWGLDGLIRQIKEKLVYRSVVFAAKRRYIENLFETWNNILSTLPTNTTHYTNITNDTHYTHNTKLKFFSPHFIEKILDSSLNGRHLELFFPLFIIADFCDDLDNMLEIAEEIISEKRDEDVYENRDISLIEYISQLKDTDDWVSNKLILNGFREFVEAEDDKWINSRWLGIALNRLNLLNDKRRRGRGVEVILNIKKAQEKIKMFK